MVDLEKKQLIAAISRLAKAIEQANRLELAHLQDQRASRGGVIHVVTEDGEIEHVSSADFTSTHKKVE